MAKKKSNDPNFKVEKTVGAAAEGEDSLLSLDAFIQNADNTTDIFIPMKRICAAMAISKRMISPGASKIRQGGSPDDFLNFATLNYVLRWKKQFEPAHGRKPVSKIQNWLPYVSNTIRYCLINYNKEVQDYDFLPLPHHFTDSEVGETEETDIVYVDTTFCKMELRASITMETIHGLVQRLPKELLPFRAEILYFINNKSQKFVSEKNKNFVIIGKNIFCKGLKEWMAE
jgi:hypothetical protein